MFCAALTQLPALMTRVAGMYLGSARIDCCNDGIVQRIEADMIRPGLFERADRARTCQSAASRARGLP